MAAFVASTRNRSFIWNFFTVCERDSSKASCNKCKAIISRGKTVTTFSTKPSINHLSSLHPVEYKAVTQQTDAKASAVQHQLSAHTASGPKQLTVDESFRQMKPWPSDHKTAVLGTRRIAEMIAVDLQPFSIVEDIGFHRVIKAFAPQYQIPSQNIFQKP